MIASLRATRLLVPALFVGAMALIAADPVEAFGGGARPTTPKPSPKPPPVPKPVPVPNAGVPGDALFSARDISTRARNADSVTAADMDGDGDVDVVSASRGDNKIAWYENNGQSFSLRTISTSTNQPRWVSPSDLDGDGDMDVLAASAFDGKVVWYQNDGASNPRFTERLVGVARGARCVVAADLDRDGDLDLISASFDDDKFAWYQNDGNENFTPHTITSTADGAFRVWPGDIDGDGDIDILTGALYDDTVAWYENNGASLPGFSRRVISTTANRVLSVFATDLDGDGDLDVASASYDDDKIAWYQNDGRQNFTPRTVSTTADGAFSVHAADLDGDGDADLLSASYFDNKIAWYENSGGASPRFTIRTLNTSASRARSVHAADLDRDGDVDVLSASGRDDSVTFYENRSIAGPRSAAVESSFQVRNAGRTLPDPK